MLGKVRGVLGPLVAGTLLHLASPAGAQTDEERAGARAAAVSGIRAFDEGRYSEAIDLLNRAENLVHAPVHWLYLARSHAALGQLVKAREYYLKLARERVADDAPQVSKDAVGSAEAALAELEAKLPYVRVVVDNAGATDVRITRNGVRVPTPLIGVPYPVDPGKHTFQAFADGMQSDPRTVVIAPGSKPTVVLTLQTAPGATASGSGGRPGPSSDGAQNMPTAENHRAGEGDGAALRIAGFAGLGLAVTGATLGTIFLLKAADTEDEADALHSECVDACSLQEQAEINALDYDVATQRTVAAIGYVAGGVCLAGGITLLILSAGSDEAGAQQNAPSVRPVFGLGYAGVSGRF